jgi:hypothetical protein
MQNIPDPDFDRMERFLAQTNFEVTGEFTIMRGSGEGLVESGFGGRKLIDIDMVRNGVAKYNVRVIGSQLA